LVSVNMRELLDAGVHFGHQTRRWNPKMKPYIFTQRNGIYIVDLRQTMTNFRQALEFLHEVAAAGGDVLFVGTKRQAQDAVEEAAERSSMYFVNQRWLGGLLTNFQTIRKSIARLKDLEAMAEDGRMDLLPKKEVMTLEREREKLQRNLSGIKEMGDLPDAVFVVDVKREQIAVREAMKLGIPIVAIVDTNCDPEGIDFVVPGNDDALRAIRLFVGAAADAVMRGRQIHDHQVAEEAAAEAEESGTDVAEKVAAAAAAASGGAGQKAEPAGDVDEPDGEEDEGGGGAADAEAASEDEPSPPPSEESAEDGEEGSSEAGGRDPDGDEDSDDADEDSDDADAAAEAGSEDDDPDDDQDTDDEDDDHAAEDDDADDGSDDNDEDSEEDDEKDD